MGEEVLMQSRKIDALLVKYYRSKNAAIREKLRKEQEKLDKMVLGKKLSQSEIDKIINGEL
jgi:hypothetical protein